MFFFSFLFDCPIDANYFFVLSILPVYVDKGNARHASFILQYYISRSRIRIDKVGAPRGLLLAKKFTQPEDFYDSSF